MSNLVVNIYSFVFAIILANSSSGSEADKLPSLLELPFIKECIEFINNNVLISSLFLLPKDY